MTKNYNNLKHSTPGFADNSSANTGRAGKNPYVFYGDMGETPQLAIEQDFKEFAAFTTRYHNEGTFAKPISAAKMAELDNSAGKRESLCFSTSNTRYASQMTFHRGQQKYIPQVNLQINTGTSKTPGTEDIEDEKSQFQNILSMSELNEGNKTSEPLQTELETSSTQIDEAR